SSSDGELEQLGSITCPSGILLILDGGLAWMWSHDRPPLLPEWSEIASSANNSVDLAVRGANAIEAGVAFDPQVDPCYLYDIPRDGVVRITESFQRLVLERKLQASIELLKERIPHRRRVDHALEYGRGTGVVAFHGMWAIAASGTPTDRSLPVMGERMPAGSNAGRWRRVWIELRDGRVARSRVVGHVLVDEARLMAVDADALGAWNDIDPLDGKADIVFWGRDAAAVAAELGAPEINSIAEPHTFGWTDLLIRDAWEH